jgi:hypothetical protein
LRQSKSLAETASRTYPLKTTVSRRIRFRGSRSVDLVKGLSLPLLCAPAWRPAHLLGCLLLAWAAWLRLGCWLLRSGRHSASPVCYPRCMHLPGDGVPTRGTSHWGHPLGESNAPRGALARCYSSFFWPLMRTCCPLCTFACAPPLGECECGGVTGSDLSPPHSLQCLYHCINLLIGGPRPAITSTSVSEVALR